MKFLGYSLTWRTACFINGGCGSTGIFAHTNGLGDFVLFDSLGPPWPVHECYEKRFCVRVDKSELTGTRILIERPTYNLTLQESRIAEYDALEQHLPDKERAVDIDRIEPEHFENWKRPLLVSGIVREVIKNHLHSLTQRLGTVGSEVTTKALGDCTSQVTIIDVDLASYTVFANLKELQIEKGALVEMDLRTVRLDALRPPHRFICDRISRPRLFSVQS